METKTCPFCGAEMTHLGDCNRLFVGEYICTDDLTMLIDLQNPYVKANRMGLDPDTVVVCGGGLPPRRLIPQEATEGAT